MSVLKRMAEAHEADGNKRTAIVLRDADRRIEALEAERDALKAALKPFVEHLSAFERWEMSIIPPGRDKELSDDLCLVSAMNDGDRAIFMSDLRRARAALAETTRKETPDA